MAIAENLETSLFIAQHHYRYHCLLKKKKKKQIIKRLRIRDQDEDGYFYK